MSSPWKKAASVSDLGQLMADWLEGRHNAYSPSSLSNGPDEETLHLVPVLAACNRAGFVTTDSQPGETGVGDDGVRWEQRAAATGWVADQRLLDRIRLHARRAGMDIIAHRPDSGWRDGAVVTRIGSKGYTWFGRTEGRRKQVAFEWAEVGGRAARELRTSTYITIFDPVWGRDNVLWPALANAIR
ncbi:hypothetical protein [Streptomyces sp. 5-6(2022)]|uniref:DUF6919 domain-containing protein n=1 Tax=Streptomyces sp. 5-6(2022) TaxID=2936510 RepID=UPI0023B9AC6B|nr:hypothetical protein [Streptomyces sp. 5-6(2022)]